MHGKYSFIQTLVERIIQQVRKHEEQVKAYDEAFTAMHYSMRPAAFDVQQLLAAAGREPIRRDAYADVMDANPERRGNGCAIYRVDS